MFAAFNAIRRLSKISCSRLRLHIFSISILVFRGIVVSCAIHRRVHWKEKSSITPSTRLRRTRRGRGRVRISGSRLSRSSSSSNSGGPSSSATERCKSLEWRKNKSITYCACPAGCPPNCDLPVIREPVSPQFVSGPHRRVRE